MKDTIIMTYEEIIAFGVPYRCIRPKHGDQKAEYLVLLRDKRTEGKGLAVILVFFLGIISAIVLAGVIRLFL